MASTLIDSLVCTVVVDEGLLVSTFPQQTPGMWFLGLLLFMSVGAIVYGIRSVSSGRSDAGVALITGIAMLLGSAYGLHWLSVEHGQITITRSELTWTRNHEIVGSWRAADIAALQTTWTLVNHRGPLRSDHQLVAETTSGQRIRIAHGIQEEVTAVASWLREAWGEDAPATAPP